METPDNVVELIKMARQLLHDINQPLTVIMARSELMMLKLPGDDPNRPAMEQIHQQTEKMSGLIDDLRTLLKDFQPD